MAALAEANPRPDKLLEAVERPPLLRFAELLEAADPPLEDLDGVLLDEELPFEAEPPRLGLFDAVFDEALLLAELRPPEVLLALPLNLFVPLVEDFLDAALRPVEELFDAALEEDFEAAFFGAALDLEREADLDEVPLLEPVRLDVPPLPEDLVAPFEDFEAALDAPFEVPPREEEPREDELLDADLDVDLVAVFEEDLPPELLDAAFFWAAFLVDFAMFNEFLMRLINFSLQITTM